MRNALAEFKHGKRGQWNMRNSRSRLLYKGLVQLHIKLRCQVMICLTRCFLSDVDELDVQKFSDFFVCRLWADAALTL